MVSMALSEIAQEPTADKHAAASSSAAAAASSSSAPQQQLSDIERKRRSQALDEAAAKIPKGQEVPRVAQQYHQSLPDQKQMEIDRKEAVKRKRKKK
jgi:hypothetical protein